MGDGGAHAGIGVQQSGTSDFVVRTSVPVRMSGRLSRMGKQYESSGTSWYELVCAGTRWYRGDESTRNAREPTHFAGTVLVRWYVPGKSWYGISSTPMEKTPFWGKYDWIFAHDTDSVYPDFSLSLDKFVLQGENAPAIQVLARGTEIGALSFERIILRFRVNS